MSDNEFDVTAVFDKLADVGDSVTLTRFDLDVLHEFGEKEIEAMAARADRWESTRRELQDATRRAKLRTEQADE